MVMMMAMCERGHSIDIIIGSFRRVNRESCRLSPGAG
jgi:hypothetical protein